MTVKELKEQLETLPDDADVYWYTGGDIQQADALLYETCCKRHYGKFAILYNRAERKSIHWCL